MSDFIIYPAVQEIIPSLSEMIRGEWGDLVEKIIIHGSAIDGRFRLNESDLDVIVLVSEHKKDGFRIVKFQCDVNERFQGVWTQINIEAKKRKGFEQLRNFENCFASRVLKSLVIYDAGRESDVEPWPREVAKKWVLENQATGAFFSLSLTCLLPSDTIWSATRSTCRGLQTLLILHEMEVHDKSIRWNMQLLLGEVIKLYPDFARFREAVNALPNDLALIDDDSLPMELGENDTDLDKRNAIALALKIIRQCGRVLSIKAADKHFRWHRSAF